MNNIDKLHKPFILISAFNKNCTESGNEVSHAHLKRDLENLGFPHKEVIGVYKGTQEKSFYVECANLTNFSILHAKAQEFGQEAVLNVDKNRKAGLIFIGTGEAQTLGTFKQVSKQEAEKQDNYTYDFTNNGYYICE